MRKRVGWVLVVVGGLIVASGVLFVFGSILVWLKEGTASPLGINQFWGGGDLQTEWVGLNKLADKFRDIPMGGVIAFGGLAVVWLGIGCLEWAEKSEAKRYSRY
ncbi:hypothetical protein [Bradyrhizobium sp. SZCCHNPS1003]|uniref:hypothetical protein n=1 Tax=Bradyrhizobium sp. SZCCHNPS1003 TaxID=3057330 RepID=UPI0028ECB206|nr:hypothetical protein [Bradyrhizobium sp. SZCCHNPS1003]